MAFTISGSTIIQKGTDDSLKGLSSLSGVNKHALGGYTVYYLTKKIQVQGNLTIDPNKEQLIFSNTLSSVEMQGKKGGSLTLGKEISKNSFTAYTKDMAIRFMRNSADACFKAEGGFTVNVFGAGIETGSYCQFMKDSILNINDMLVFHRTNGKGELRIDTDKGKIDKLEVRNYSFVTFLRVPPIFTGFKPIHITRGAIGTSSATTNNSFLNFNDYDGKGNTVDAIIYSETFLRLNNTVLGSNLKIRGEGSRYNLGVIEVTKEFIFSAKDSNGKSVSGIKTYIKDYNHSNRVKYNASTDYIADRIYQATTGANGETAPQKVLVAVATRGGSTKRTSNGAGNFNVGANIIDIRAKTNKLGDDKFDINIASYKYQLAKVERPFKGAGVLKVEEKLLDDTQITETDINKVKAYSVLNTPHQLSDYSKWWQVENHPQKDTRYVIRQADQCTLGAYDLVIDKKASTPFSVKGSVITIKADVFTGNIKTSELVTLKNGAVVDGLIEDKNNDSLIKEKGGSEFSIFQTEADRISNSNAIATNTRLFRFKETTYKGKTLYLVVKDTGLYASVVIKKGDNSFELSTKGLLSSIVEITTKLDNMLQPSTSGNFAFTKEALKNTPSSNKDIKTLYNARIATTTKITTAVTAGQPTLNVDTTAGTGYYNNHKIVINDGTGSPISRVILTHTSTPNGSMFLLDNPVNAVAVGEDVLVLIETKQREDVNIASVAGTTVTKIDDIKGDGVDASELKKATDDIKNNTDATAKQITSALKV